MLSAALQRRFDALHAQPRSLPTRTEIKVVVVRGGGVGVGGQASRSHQRPVRACFSGATRSGEPFSVTTRKLLSQQ